jgi:hypothetical protein
MMERRESHLTHRQPSNKASLAWLLVCTVGAALFAVMIAAQGALAHANHDPQARFFQRCAWTKTGQFDPFYPNSTTQNLFFGATNISVDSTRDSLLLGGTTCRFKDGTDGGNNSGYWIPDLRLRNGAWAGGVQLNAYYGKGASSVDPHVIEPFPDGLKMHIRDTNTSKTDVKWYCSNISGEGNNGDFEPRPYDCKDGLYPYVTTRITFPQCGNGLADSTNHISHVVYAGSAGCPSSHTEVYPRLFITAKYNTSLGSGARMADGSDPRTGFHSYYFEAWKLENLQHYVNACIVAGINCNSTPPHPQPPAG